MDTYVFGDGWRARSKLTAAEAHDALEAIRAKEKLTATAVFQAARPKNAALHPEFVWGAKEAIEELGLNRARQLIRAVRVVKEALPDEVPEVRHVYFHAPEAGERQGAYEVRASLVDDEELFGQALSEALRQLSAVQGRVEELRQLAVASDKHERVVALETVTEGFRTLRSALEVLRAS